MKLGQLIALTILAATGTLARAEPAPLKLEGSFHFTAGYKDTSCLRHIVIKAVRDAQTGAVSELDVFAAENLEKPEYRLLNRGMLVGSTYKNVDTVTDTDADNIEYNYEYGIRSINFRVHFRVVQTWFDGEELRSFNGQDLCNYARD